MSVVKVNIDATDGTSRQIFVDLGEKHIPPSSPRRIYTTKNKFKIQDGASNAPNDSTPRRYKCPICLVPCRNASAVRSHVESKHYVKSANTGCDRILNVPLENKILQTPKLPGLNLSSLKPSINRKPILRDGIEGQQNPDNRINDFSYVNIVQKSICRDPNGDGSNVMAKCSVVEQMRRKDKMSRKKWGRYKSLELHILTADEEKYLYSLDSVSQTDPNINLPKVKAKWTVKRAKRNKSFCDFCKFKLPSEVMKLKHMVVCENRPVFFNRESSSEKINDFKNGNKISCVMSSESDADVEDVPLNIGNSGPKDIERIQIQEKLGDTELNLVSKKSSSTTILDDDKNKVNNMSSSFISKEKLEYTKNEGISDTFLREVKSEKGSLKFTANETVDPLKSSPGKMHLGYFVSHNMPKKNENEDHSNEAETFLYEVKLEDAQQVKTETFISSIQSNDDEHRQSPFSDTQEHKLLLTEIKREFEIEE